MDKTASPTFQDVFPMVGRGVQVYRRQPGLVSVLALAVVVVYGVFRIMAQNLVDDGQLIGAFFVDFVGFTVATMLAFPWFKIVLTGEREEEPGASPFAGLEWSAMFVATLFFWGGVLLGVRYLIGIPSIFMLIWYGLFGFAVADGEAPGLQALGTSVRLGQGRRGVVGGLALVLAIFNMFAAIPLSFGLNAATAVASVALLVVTTNISMGAGAHLYDWLVESEGA